MKFNLHILKTLKENYVLITPKKFTNPYQPKKGFNLLWCAFSSSKCVDVTCEDKKHSIFTYDNNWNAMIWKDKYKEGFREELSSWRPYDKYYDKKKSLYRLWYIIIKMKEKVIILHDEKHTSTFGWEPKGNIILITSAQL
jgi:hypothetical protein